MNVKDIQPGFVFQMNHELGGQNDLYLILDSRLMDTHMEVRWLYISGRDAGMTFRTLLRPDGDWGDWRIM